MIIIAIETSCDETAISIVECAAGMPLSKGTILSHQVLTQIQMHQEWGGVVPNIAKREHSRNLIPILIKALQESGLATSHVKAHMSHVDEVETILERENELLQQFKKYVPTIQIPQIDLIAVTYGPGLEPALWVGINFAKALSQVWNVPLIPADHMEGHLLSALVQTETIDSLHVTSDQESNVKGHMSMVLTMPEFPLLALLISGGHTELILMRDWGEYELIGSTRDDAVGEAFDKVARMLDLPYPGGPEISKLAKPFDISKGSGIAFPRPMIHTKDYDFSFSGIKTSVMYLLKKLTEAGPLEESVKTEIAYEFESAVTEVLVRKTMRAAEEFGVESVIVGGGVSANKRIRAALTEACLERSLSCHFPPAFLTGDNATMIALAAFVRSKGGSKNFLKHTDTEFKSLRAKGNLTLYK